MFIEVSLYFKFKCSKHLTISVSYGAIPIKGVVSFRNVFLNRVNLI